MANAFVKLNHSHHKPVRGCKFAIGVELDDGPLRGPLLGVCIVARPVAQALDDGYTFEVTRLCTCGHPNAASFLLGAAWRAARAMGAHKIVSYTRIDEAGTCYRAAGWTPNSLRNRKDGWDHGNKSQRWLPGMYTSTTERIQRVRWEKTQ